MIINNINELFPTPNLEIKVCYNKNKYMTIYSIKSKNDRIILMYNNIKEDKKILWPSSYSLYDILNENNINIPIEVIDWNK